MPVDFNQYSTAKQYLGAFVPAWVTDDLEKDRISSYAFYEQVYWTIDQAFSVVQRGKDTRPIYIPSGRTIVETMNRYMAPGMTIGVDPVAGTPQARTLAEQVMSDFCKRERLYSKFSSAKRYGLIRGDWVWHITADPNREPGSKVSLNVIDPASWFPIYSDTDPDLVIGVRIVDEFHTEAGEPRLKVLVYRKQTGLGGPSPITVEQGIYKMDDWGGPGMSQEPQPESILLPLTTLPAPIDDLPVYPIPNNAGDSPYGSSEMRGIERLMAGINQGISDEDLSLVMDGLGVYATDAGTPVDPDTGEEVGWNLGPAKVVGLPEGSKFERVSGVVSVAPFQDHLRYLHDRMNDTVASPAIARGDVDSTTAESGIALELKLAPLLSSSDERDRVITDVFANILYNLPKWFVAYEGSIMSPLMEARFALSYAAKIPVNKAKALQDWIALVGAKLVSGQTARNALRDLGYAIPDETTETGFMLAEQSIDQAMQADVIASRVGTELAATDPLLNAN